MTWPTSHGESAMDIGMLWGKDIHRRSSAEHCALFSIVGESSTWRSVGINDPRPLGKDVRRSVTRKKMVFCAVGNSTSESHVTFVYDYVSVPFRTTFQYFWHSQSLAHEILSHTARAISHTLASLSQTPQKMNNIPAASQLTTLAHHSERKVMLRCEDAFPMLSRLGEISDGVVPMAPGCSHIHNRFRGRRPLSQRASVYCS